MRLFPLLLVAAFLVGCNTTKPLAPTEIPSTDTTDSAPTGQRDVSQIPDAVPQPVVRTRAGNKSPYTVLGKTYTLLPDSKDYKERGYASWYGTKFHGRRTANGEVYDMWAMTAAHKTLPIPSYVQVTNVENGRTITVKVNDRGPFHGKRIIDLSYGAAVKLGFAKKGVALVDVVDVTPSTGQAVASPSKSSPKVTSSVAKPSSINDVWIQAPPSGQPRLADKTSTPTPKVEPSPKVSVQTPAAKPPVVKPASDKSQGRIYQVGAFQKRDSAKQLQAKLAGILRVPVKVVANAQNTWHRVRVGPIIGAQAMSETRQLLSEQGIVKLQPVHSSK